MEQVIYLPVRERAVLEPELLLDLNAKLGARVADNLVCRSMEDLALRLAEAERAFRSGDDIALRKTCRMIAAMSDQLGLRTLMRVACDVLHCLETHDMVAMAATLARLIRTGESSMSAVWDHQAPLI